MTRVCHITTVHPATDTRILHKECRSLLETGYEVSLVAPGEEDAELDGIQLVALNRRSRNRAARMIRRPPQAYQAALALDADLYHFHDPEFLPYAVRLARRGRRVVYDVHEDVPVQILHKDWMAPAARPVISRAFSRLESECIARLDGFVAVNEQIARRLRAHQPRGVVVTNYPRLEEIRPAPSWRGRARAAGYVGSISRVRGARDIVDAMAFSDAELRLAGSFSPPTLVDELRTLPGWSRVRCLGDISRDGVVAMLAEIKVGVIPLHPIRNYLDAYPVKLFEYMAAGIPVVATDIPRWRELLEEHDCGVCVPHGEPERMAEAIDGLLDDDERAQAMGERGRRAAEALFSWETQADSLRALYRDLLA